MIFDKPFKTIDQQIALLRQRGLIINNENNAKEYLSTYSYYDLINGYKNLFMPNDFFIKNLQIEYLFTFAFIDKSVQALLMKYSLMLEVKFKTNLAYVLAKNIGVHEADYLHQRFYKTKVNKNLLFSKVKTEINKQLDLSKAKQPTKHYLKHHNHVPPWILFKNLSLGTSINLFQCLASKNKQEVANLLLPDNSISLSDKIELLITILEGVRVFRNCAAHNLNFIECKTPYNIPGEILYKLLPKGVLKKENGSISTEDKASLRGLFGIIISTTILLPQNILCQSMITEFEKSLSSKSANVESLCQLYRQLSNIPEDFLDRFKLLIN